MSTAVGLDQAVLRLCRELTEGRLIEIQVRLAAELGDAAARGVGLPRVPLPRHWLQWLMAIHRGLPAVLQRVLRGATRHAHFGIAPRVSLRWACACAARAVDGSSALDGSASPAANAILVARQALEGAATEASCAEAALTANASILMAPNERIASAIYAAREAVEVARVVLASPEPRWLRCDLAANHAGHTARWAARARGDEAAELAWQQHRLAELILESDASEWT